MDAGAVKAGQVYVEITAEDAALRRGLEDSRRQLQEFQDGVGAMQTLGTGLLAGGGAVLAGLAYTSKVFGDFDDVMRSVQGVSGATGEAFERLTAQARELARAALS